MKHEIVFDSEKRILTVRVDEVFTLEETIELENKMTDLVPGEENFRLLIDMLKSTAKLDKQIRNRLQEQMSDERISNIAVLVANPAVRMVGKVIIAAMGKSADTKFFSSNEDALAWLQAKE